MELSLILLGENDDFLHKVEKVNPDEPSKEEQCAPPSSKFDDDINALRDYIGESEFRTGLSIEMTLAELLNIVPRQRRRTDAYNSLIKHLKETMNIKLIIKTKNYEQKK